MLNHESEHKKALKTGKFPASNQKIRTCLTCEQIRIPRHLYMFEFCPKKFSNTLLSSTSTTMFNTSRQKIINVKLI